MYVSDKGCRSKLHFTSIDPRRSVREIENIPNGLEKKKDRYAFFLGSSVLIANS